MNRHSNLSYAIAAILGSGAAAIGHAATTSDTEANSDQIAEITVTAQRRTESIQNVPITIQALTAETLTQLNVQTIDDFLKYLPNVTSANSGPGQETLFMRGLSTITLGVQGSSGVGSFPNTAIYLDDQSGALPGRNLDVYAADMERIEVLEGPQGTLFGAGAESGVLRYITNKPKLDVTEGNVSASYSTTAHGDPSNSGQAVINLPLIPDTLAVRAVIYNDRRGGYINSVPGTFTRQCTDVGIHYAGYAQCAGSGPYPALPATPQNSATNANFVANAINPVTYQGFRLSALYKFNDDWNALVTQSYQKLDAEGVFYETPRSSGTPGTALPDLSVQLYTPSFNKDRFENTALTVNGKIGDLKFVYTGSYLVRNVDNESDYTNYTRGVYADYYQCMPGGGTAQGACYSPVNYWRDTERNTHNSQELRLSTPDDWRVRGLVGVFWEDFKVNENMDWFYRNAPSCTATLVHNCFINVGPPNGDPRVTPPYNNADVNNPSIRPGNESFFDDIKRGYRQQALFGSADFEIVPKTLTLTLGTRYYRLNTTETGFTGSSFDCKADVFGPAVPAPCPYNQPPFEPSPFYASDNESQNNLNITYKGFRSRANLSWKVTSDVLLYYTWSQGFRPGGFNRGAIEKTPPGASYTFQEPQSFGPDTLVNNEIGWKTQWFDHSLQVNGAIYREDWKNVQEVLFESCCFGNLSFVINGPNYKVQGAELSVVAVPVHGLTIIANAAWNSSNLVSESPLLDVTGKPITDPRIGQPFGAVGSPLAQSPSLESTLRIRYDFTFGDYKSWAQIGAQHQSHAFSATSRTTTPNEPGYAYDEPGFTTYDASFGIAKDNWTVDVFGENITDVRADLYENPYQFIDSKVVNRPATWGLRIGFKFQ